MLICSPLSSFPQMQSGQKWVALPKISCPSCSTCTANLRRMEAKVLSAALCWTLSVLT